MICVELYHYPPLQTCQACITRVLLHVYLRHPLLCLYRCPSNRDGQLFQEVRRYMLAVLSYQDYFDPNIFEIDVSDLNTYWNVLGTLFRNDVLLSAKT